MQERVEMLGDPREIKASPGNGKVVRATVPINGNHKAQK
jgi:signal transduction histidine kinase